METVDELIALPTTLSTAASSSSWVERRDCLTTLTDCCVKHHSTLRDAGKIDSLVERVLERLEDGSVKVQSHAIVCLERLYREATGVLLIPSLQLLLVPALLAAASSANRVVGAAATTLMHAIFGALPAQGIASQLCSTAVHDGNSRLRALSLRLLAEYMGRFCEQTDNPANSNIVRR